MSEESIEDLEDIAKGAYLDGYCYEMAAALHRMTGWPIVALRTQEHDYRHAAVRDPSGNLYDARGPVTEDRFGKPFTVRPPFDLREVTLDEIRTVVRPVEEHDIERAMKIAESIWPELAVHESTRLQRVRAFMEELEQLSRKHGIWIRAPIPASVHWPCLADGDGTEQGYELTVSADANAYRFERLL